MHLKYIISAAIMQKRVFVGKADCNTIETLTALLLYRLNRSLGILMTSLSRQIYRTTSLSATVYNRLRVLQSSFQPDTLQIFFRVFQQETVSHVSKSFHTASTQS